jgi:hypothetical protein
VPPGGSTKSVVTFELTLPGTVESFDSQAFKEGLIAALGGKPALHPSNILVFVRPASIIVSVTIVTESELAAHTILDAVNGLTPTSLSAALNSPVAAIGVPSADARVFSGPSPPPPTEPPPLPPSPSPPPSPQPPWWSHPCPSGFEQTAPNGECVVCARGSYQEAGTDVHQSCRPCLTGELQPFEAQTSCLVCPERGVNCNRRDGFEVLAGFYATKEALQDADMIAWSCPTPLGCQGGTVLGNESCAPGHTGALCGICDVGYYSNRKKRCSTCEHDPESGSLSVTSVFALTSGVGAFLLTCCVAYLYNGARLSSHGKQQSIEGVEGGWRVTKLLSLFPKRLIAASTIFRVSLSYCQCVTVVASFNNIAWPLAFIKFLQVLEYTTIEIFALLPAECAVNQR